MLKLRRSLLAASVLALKQVLNVREFAGPFRGPPGHCAVDIRNAAKAHWTCEIGLVHRENNLQVTAEERR